MAVIFRNMKTITISLILLILISSCNQLNRNESNKNKKSNLIDSIKLDNEFETNQKDSLACIIHKNKQNDVNIL
jgi:hypothetical protein